MTAAGFIPLIFLSGPVLLWTLSRTRTRPVDIITLTQVAALSASLIGLLTESESVSYRWEWFTTAGKTFWISFTTGETERKLQAFICLTGTLVTVWSGYYFPANERHTRFYHVLSLFMAAMSALVIASDLLLVFCLWELVGLCSYLLVGHYRHSTEAGRASFSALLTNKIGDAGFLMALMVCWTAVGTTDISRLMEARASMGTWQMTLLGIGLLMAIASKSAQFPFHGWLPQAMAGPTPASALIHSATMVAAGVFLFWRLDGLFSTEIRFAAGCIGLITAVIGGWNALTEHKLKRLLAWSTMSQLGLMIMTAGWGHASATLLHLQVHGILKAGLFMVTGSVLLRHASHSTDAKSSELESIGRSASVSRPIAAMLLGLCLALSGMPLTSGFLSKEVLWQNQETVWGLTGFMVITALTVAYLARMLWYLLRAGASQETTGSHWREWLAFSIPAAAVLWIPLPPSAFALTYLYALAHGPIGWMSVIWVSGLGFIAWKIRRTSWYGRKVPAFNIDRTFQQVVGTVSNRLSEAADRIDRRVIDRMVRAFGVAAVVTAHLVAFFDRWILDGAVRLLGVSARALGTGVRRMTGRTTGSYLWWTFAALLILLIWQS